MVLKLLEIYSLSKSLWERGKGSDTILKIMSLKWGRGLHSLTFTYGVLLPAPEGVGIPIQCSLSVHCELSKTGETLHELGGS